jgi:hypothetical protein
MNKKTITLGGKEYAVVFNMQAMLNYEFIAGKSFFGEDFALLKERMALIVAAVTAADEEAELKLTDLVNGADIQVLKDIITAFAVVMTLVSDFFGKPAVEPEDKSEDNEEDKKKN